MTLCQKCQFYALKITIQNNEWLTDKHINAAQKILKKQFPNITGLQNPILAHEGCFDICSSSNMAQILHCGSYKHWVAIANIKSPKNTVFVYNSFDEKVPHDILEQICNIIQSSSSVLIQSKPMQIVFLGYLQGI